MTSHGEPRVWLEHFPPGEATPFTHDYHGLRYTGEVIRADSWSPDWGEPLSGDTFFRIVLLRQRRSNLRPSIQDPRIVLSQPGAGGSRQHNSMTRELATIRETQALYFTQRSSESDFIHRTIQRRQEVIEEQLLADEAERYARGSIASGAETPPYPGNFFAGANPLDWFARIARWLLSYTYPDPPVRAVLLPRPVSGDDPARLHQAIFRHPGAPPDLLAELGPGLALCRAEDPQTLSLPDCPLFPVIEEYLDREGERVPWSRIQHYLAHQMGLIRPLADLYLLLYLHQQGQSLEVRLVPGHRLSLVGGALLAGDRLPGDLVPSLHWDAGTDIAAWFTEIDEASQPGWNDTVFLLSLLAPGITALSQGEDFASQEQQVLYNVSQIRQKVDRVREFLELVAANAEDDGPVAEAREILDRISLIEGDGYLPVYASARRAYPDHRQLAQALQWLDRLDQLAGQGAELQECWRYLSALSVPTALAELSLEEQAVRAALSPGSVLRLSRSWSALSPQFHAFKARYAAAYRAHHRDWHRRATDYRRDLEAARLKLHALTLLNSLSELGEPAGQGLEETLEGLSEPGPQGCPVPEDQLDLEASPSCSACGLSLSQGLPADDLARLLATLDTLLAEKNRRLSVLLVDKILQGQADQRMDNLLKIVQASDLSALSNTLNPELVSYIRQVLG